MWQKIIASKLYTGILLSFVFLIGLGTTYLTLSLSKVFVKNPFRNVLPTPNAYAIATPKALDETSKQKGIYNVLLLGHGGAGHAGSLLTDSIIIVHVDTNTKKVSFVSVPRDLWVPGNRKLNSEGSINGFQNIGSLVTTITGLPINYFVSVDFGGFSKIIDHLGGITVDVPITFDDAFYPIVGQENNVCGITESEIFVLKNKYSGFDLEKQFTCRYEHLHFEKGPVNLDGATALKFVRSRHGDSDFGRSARQFAVLQGIGSKLVSFQMANKFNSIVNTIFQIVKTDLDAGTIKSLVEVFGDTNSYSVNQIQLTTDNVLKDSKSSDGQYILVPKAGNFNFSEVKDYISSNIK